ncbi:MAG TPA: UDP-N-acetylglucosamine 2-epimerase (non-hydrolyzing) [Bryobacteraceae bacterium]|nr:UDP-N-acetylglucosamine 2-epimerase (non-hydrolyzing) [Bryobacteraceae bacterium]
MKILLVVGARPNFMKVAPIMRALAAKQCHGSPEICLVHTGQHYDARMSDSFFADLQLPEPRYHLAAGSGSHAQQTGRVLTAFEPVCERESPACVVVAGDVNSTLACALTAKKLGIDVAHVEAGLRSRDHSMPEEINRVCTDAISDILFTTDTLANENLRSEGVPEHKIRFVGNTMIDSLLANLKRALACPLPEGVEAGQFVVVTLHRPGNVDDPGALGGLIDTVVEISRRAPVVFPVHPRTRGNLERFGLAGRLDAGDIHVLEPQGYFSFIGMVARCRMVMTDSGGIQEETTVLNIPCLTLRENTERPITCISGTNMLVGTAPANIRTAAHAVLDGRAPRGSVPAKWDGKAGQRIADELLARYSVPPSDRAVCHVQDRGAVLQPDAVLSTPGGVL